MSAERLGLIAKELRESGEPQRVTVREFLSWFGAERRGFWIVKRMRRALKMARLVTDPDFESAYLDSYVKFVLLPDEPEKQDDVSAANHDAAEAVSEAASSVATPASVAKFAASDPAYRISKLEAANKIVVSVAPTAPLAEAITLMLINNYSQLPVMPSGNERDVKGMVSWQSIGRRLVLKPAVLGGMTQEFMDPHQEVAADESIFQVIEIVSRHDYVLVRAKDRRITGVVTASDLNGQFQQLAEPFLLLGEIENNVRRAIESRFSSAELQDAKDPEDGNRSVSSVADLAFGEYIRLLSKAERWDKLKWGVDRATFIARLDRVRGIRNDVMHFDPDGVPKEDLGILRDFAAFLERMHSLAV